MCLLYSVLDRATALVCGVLTAAAAGSARQAAPAGRTVDPPAPRVELAWQRDVSVRGAPFLAAGPSAIYLADSEGALTAFALQDGRDLWTVPVRGRLAPAVAEGRLAVAREADLLWLDAPTGREARALREADVSGVAWLGTDLIVAARTTVSRLDAEGGVRWRRGLPSAVSALAARGQVILVGTASGQLARLDPSTGAVRWQLDCGAAPVAVSLGSDRAVVTTSGPPLLAVGLARGTELWRHVRVTALGAARLDRGRVFATYFDHTVQALHLRTGSILWTRSAGGRPALGPVRFGDSVAVLTTDGTVIALDDAGKPMATKHEPGSAQSRGRHVTASAAGEAPAVLAAVSIGVDGSSVLTVWRSRPDSR
jgi:outer membrane protein assembly factor BamB